MTKTGAEDITWDLTDLYASPEAALVALNDLRPTVQSFRDTHYGHIAGMAPTELVHMLISYEGIVDQMGRLYTYAFLWWSTQTTEPSAGKFLQQVREGCTTLHNQLIFVDLSLTTAPDEIASAWTTDPVLQKWSHYITLRRSERAYLRSELEEQLLAEKQMTGVQAWTRFFDELMARLVVELDGERLSEQEALARLHDVDRDTRRRAAQAFTRALQAEMPSLVFIFNTVLADKASEDRLRKNESWISARNRGNEVSDGAVDALVDSVTSRYDLVQRYYRLKAKVLSIDDFADFDRYAPMPRSDRSWSWRDAQALVTQSYATFHPDLGTIVEQFFHRRWIDARLVSGKRGGAFSHGAVPSAHPYILMNFTGQTRDVQTLAHELGHGVHQYLSRKQGPLLADTPLTTAETASVFGEMLTFQALRNTITDADELLPLLLSKIDDSIATVFRQVAMNRFEHRIHTHRRERGELEARDFNEHWLATQQEMFGDACQISQDYTHWWSYIPHFLHTPGYVYAYAFGELLVLSLYAKYQTMGSSFANLYLELLEAGGSNYPHELLKPFGIDLNESSFWQEGLAGVEQMIDEAEKLAG